MGVTIQRATSVVEAGAPSAPALPASPAEGPPSQAELARTAALLAMVERDRRRLCAEGFDD